MHQSAQRAAVLGREPGRIGSQRSSSSRRRWKTSSAAESTPAAAAAGRPRSDQSAQDRQHRGDGEVRVLAERDAGAGAVDDPRVRPLPHGCAGRAGAGPAGSRPRLRVRRVGGRGASGGEHRTRASTVAGASPQVGADISSGLVVSRCPYSARNARRAARNALNPGSQVTRSSRAGPSSRANASLSAGSSRTWAARPPAPGWRPRCVSWRRRSAARIGYAARAPPAWRAGAAGRSRTVAGSPRAGP